MCLFFLMIRRPPRSTRTDTLSLHDALPISQIAATLLGIGDQIGYAGLIDKRLGITLDKSLSRTDWARRPLKDAELAYRSEEHTSELQSLMRISYAVFCLKKKITKETTQHHQHIQDYTQLHILLQKIL